MIAKPVPGPTADPHKPFELGLLAAAVKSIVLPLWTTRKLVNSCVVES